MDISVDRLREIEESLASMREDCLELSIELKEIGWISGSLNKIAEDFLGMGNTIQRQRISAEMSCAKKKA